MASEEKYDASKAAYIVNALHLKSLLPGLGSQVCV